MSIAVGMAEMTKYRVHLEHDKSVVVESNGWEVLTGGVLVFGDGEIITHAFGPTRWVWVEEEKE